MINIYNELSSSDFEKLIKQLEENNDVENSIVILQLIKLNLESELNEKDIKDDFVNKNKVELKSKLDHMINGFFETPAKLLGLDISIDEYVEKETGFSLLPKTKEKRAEKAFDVIKKIAEIKISKNKALQKQELKSKHKTNVKESKTKKELREKLKIVQMEINKELEKNIELNT